MSDPRFLITGATGATGGAAAAQLLEKGRSVRAFVHREDERSEALRERGAEVIVGDLLPIEQWAELVAGASSGGAPRNDAASLYAEADRITGRPGSEFLMQHLREVAIDHTNGVFEGTNDFVEKIGGRPPLTVEAFVTKHRSAFE